MELIEKSFSTPSKDLHERIAAPLKMRAEMCCGDTATRAVLCQNGSWRAALNESRDYASIVFIVLFGVRVCVWERDVWFCICTLKDNYYPNIDWQTSFKWITTKIDFDWHIKTNPIARIFFLPHIKTKDKKTLKPEYLRKFDVELFRLGKLYPVKFLSASGRVFTKQRCRF